MDILDLISKDTGIAYKKKASTRGAEHSGPCPWCLGDDRFSIHPYKNHYVCRKCKKAGDSIHFIMDYHSKSYTQACTHLGITPSISFKSLNTATEKPGQNEIVWKPKDITIPPEVWQQKAQTFLFASFKFLMSANGIPHRQWLNQRGIKDETIKKARLGWNPATINFNLESWGLPSERHKNGKNKLLWLPKGLIIPQFYNQKLIRLRIRQESPLSINRFVIVSGSATGFFNYEAHINTFDKTVMQNYYPSLITESELDGWLLWQESKGLCQVFASGSASAKPDTATHDLLNARNQSGLINLDNDEAGKKELPWWSGQYPEIKQLLSHKKDPGEDFQKDVNIKNWVKKGLATLSSNPETTEKLITNTSFKQKTLDKYKNRQKTPEKEPIKPKIVQKTLKAYTNKQCIHFLFCGSLRDDFCLINKEKVWLLDKCPRDYWYKHKSGCITEIILGPGVKK